ncbi:hypothetical protein K431DRAFT_211630, partial [Polychaeton citri CBS 116435]
MLLSHGADVNAQGGEYGSALQAACFRGYEKIVEMLLSHGVDVTAYGEYSSALLTARSMGHVSIVEMLI